MAALTGANTVNKLLLFCSIDDTFAACTMAPHDTWYTLHTYKPAQLMSKSKGDSAECDKANIAQADQIRLGSQHGSNGLRGCV